MHITIEKTLGIAISLTLCAGIGVPLLNFALNIVEQSQTYQQASSLMKRIDYGVNIVLKEGGNYIDSVNLDSKISLWCDNKTIYCRYGETENDLLEQSYSVPIDLTPPSGFGEFLLSIFIEDSRLQIRFLR